MTQVVLSSKYQIVLPEDIRRQLDLKPGQKLQVLVLGGHVHVIPVRPMREAFGMFPGIDTTVPRDDEDRV